MILAAVLLFALAPASQELQLTEPIVFEAGKDALEAKSIPVLEKVQKMLEARDFVSTLRIEVHSDTDAEQKLTEKRALAVAHWLVAHGVDCKRLIAVGFGATKPIADNSTPAGKAENRRTTLVIAGLRGKAINGMPLDGGGKVAGDVCAK